MDIYSDSYTASLKRNKKIIITQNPDFINYILNYNITVPTTIKKITKFNGREYVINNLRYMRITQNQLMILDAP